MFNVGETVICVKARNATRPSGICHLTKGKLYEVLANDRHLQIQITNDQGEPVYYGSSRFESVTKAYGSGKGSTGS